MVSAVAFSPDGRLLASGGAHEAAVWELSTGKAVTRIPEPRAERLAAFSPDGKILFTRGLFGKEVGFWALPDGKELTWPGDFEGRRGSLALSPDGKTVACTVNSGHLCLWDLRTGKKLRQFDNSGGGIRSTIFSPDGKILATGHSNATIRLWEVASGKHLVQLMGHRDAVHCLSFSADGKRLASASEECTAVVWSLPAVFASLQKHPGVLKSEALEELWGELGETNALRAQRAVWTLVDV